MKKEKKILDNFIKGKILFWDEYLELSIFGALPRFW